ncbi:MAG: hypothetical protein F9K24_22020 [Leptonema illini]|uniref:Uncharacterized protein n=1 Tax=Leptonema illini TaxID=183 RepID=A0A833GWN0_9LEPT|nr:MAG: hypothetical protein F9K24_22020 [Leptonema illini]
MNDPGFGELGDGGNRPSGIYLGFYNKLDLVNRYIDGKDSDRMERMAGSIDPLTATVNQFNPVSILANSIQNVRVASEVYGTDEAYMWEAQVLGAYKGMANTLGTAVAAAFSWTGVGIAIGAAIIASGNAIQVDTKTGSRDAVMNDRAAVGTAIGLASMYAGNLTSGANVGAADRLLAAAVNTSASSIGAGFSYNDHGNITGWTLSGSNGSAFWQNMGTGALSAGISEGFIQGFNVNNAYAKDIISSVSSTGVNTFAEYYKYNQGYQNNYAAMANPDIGNASAFWGLAVTMGGRASRDNSATNTTSGDWSWDNAMSGFAEGFLGEFTGWVGLGSAGMDLFRDLANQTDQAYRVGMSAAGIVRRKEEEAGWVDYYGDDDTLDDRLRSSLSDFDPEYMEQKLAEAMGEPPEGERMGQTPPGMNPQFQSGTLGKYDVFSDMGITIHKGWTGDVDSLFERMPDNPEISKNDKNEDKSYTSWNSVRGHKDTYQMIVFQTDENGDEVQMIRIVQKNTTTGGWDETRYVMRNGALVEKSVEARNANGVRLSGSIMGNTKKLDPAKALANEAVVPTRTTLTFRQYNRQTDPTYGGNPQMVSVSNSTSANQFEPQFDVWNAITGEHMGAYSQTTFGGDTRDGRNYSFDPALRRSENLESLLPGFRGHQTVGWNAGRTLYTTNNVVRNVPGHRQNRQTEYQGTPPSTSGLEDWVR